MKAAAREFETIVTLKVKFLMSARYVSNQHDFDNCVF